VDFAPVEPPRTSRWAFFAYHVLAVYYTPRAGAVGRAGRREQRRSLGPTFRTTVRSWTTTRLSQCRTARVVCPSFINCCRYPPVTTLIPDTARGLLGPNNAFAGCTPGRFVQALCIRPRLITGTIRLIPCLRLAAECTPGEHRSAFLAGGGSQLQLNCGARFIGSANTPDPRRPQQTPPLGFLLAPVPICFGRPSPTLPLLSCCNCWVRCFPRQVVAQLLLQRPEALAPLPVFSSDPLNTPARPARAP